MPILSLSERLAILRKTSPIPDVDDLEGEAEGQKEDLILYKAQYAFPKPDEKLFLALYTPYILKPLAFDWFALRDFQPFLLGNACYVLNTFQQLDIDIIFQMYIRKVKPNILEDYQRLCSFCGHLELCVPAIYQSRIEALIRSIKS